MLLFRVFLALYYVKLQNAYITESNKVGQFAIIGYEMASTTNFTYSDKVSGTDGTIAIPTAVTALWNAKANVALNSCTQNSEWGLFGTASTGSGIDYSTGVKKGAAVSNGDKDQDCVALTSSFTSIGVDN